MIRLVISTAIALSIFLGASPRDASALPIGAVRPVPIDDGGIVVDPGDDGDLICYAAYASAEARLAKKLVKCGHAERTRSPALFNAKACQKKAMKKYRVGTKGLDCNLSGGGKGGGGGGVVFKYSCSGLMCTCTGDADCNDMFTNAGCGDVSSCDTSGSEPSCSCLLALD